MLKSLFYCFPIIFTFFTAKEPKQFKISGLAQGTDYAIMYYANDKIVTKDDIDSLLHEIDKSMSLYQEGSLINQFNAASQEIKVDDLLQNVLKKSFDINKDTKGIFDVTVAPLVQAWGFGPKNNRIEPTSDEIKLMLKCTGMNNIQLQNGRLLKTKKCIQIDLNGIAQGYSVDLIANYLSTKGIRSFVAELGGEIRVSGPKPDGTPMKIGIEGPDVDGTPLIRHIAEFNSGAITTSGNYRKFYQSGNKRISHLIDAKSGYPVDNEMISVTVYAKDAITADGYDNALMAMHLPQALKFVEKRKDLEAYFVYHKKDGAIADTLSTGFRKLISN